MSSLTTKPSQIDRCKGYFIPLASLENKIYAYSGTPTNPGDFTIATWAQLGAGVSLSSINAPGAGILKDHGTTIVSSQRTFRKVQLVVNKYSPNANASTFGVGGKASTSPKEDYFTGYIELGFDGVGTPAPVASFGR
jgi:hypothetical protein